MIRIIIQESLSDQLRGVSEPCEVFDSAGHRLGLFTPMIYEGYECPCSVEELDRREREGGGRSWAEIRHDLELT